MVSTFTDLPAKTPLAGFVHPTSNEVDVYVADWLVDVCQKHVTGLQVALEEIHRNVAVRSDKLRQKARGRRDRKSQVKFAGFSVGDFVLVGLVVNRPTKLALYWRGPCQATRVITDHVMETQLLVSPYEVTAHPACRLKMYYEGDREVTEVLEAQIAFGDGRFHVERLDKAPYVFRKWAEANKEDPAVAALIKTLDFP
ncbi:hypothetical protein H257_13065 [Aphanomyces astaci]|uniref:Chromo domain-containing protein n=1 Tax=Aphanomyces astaci TaxID=112090 RepID=W4FY79_APHAT|nr:hypothetical protein H257_13065 [Aphanomyces astaci]ETV71603.1 hypothetical protein H257_13065 [Aphanomyces astaci]|eukprot:XP_009838791.1 hypothetical protein H257_13065 [Aphanomyces astaci]